MMDKKQSLLLLSAVAVGTAVYNIFKPVRSAVPVVPSFDKERFLGTWHEIARLDFFWEKNLSQVRATYGLTEDGRLTVENVGYDKRKKTWKRKKGKARFVRSETEGALEVSFFGPLYAPYNVVHVDQDYRYALVFGGNTDYMWILSRDPYVPEAIRQKYVQYAMRSGYATENLVWTEQE